MADGDIMFTREILIVTQVSSNRQFWKHIQWKCCAINKGIMKHLVLYLLLVVAIVYVAARPEEQTYTNKFDNIDVDQILQSDRLLNNYFKCLMDQGRCTAEGTELKKVLPDALATECKKCSDKQKEISKKVIKYLVDNKPELWQKLVDKYDPSKIYRVKFEEEAKKIGITV